MRRAKVKATTKVTAEFESLLTNSITLPKSFFLHELRRSISRTASPSSHSQESNAVQFPRTQTLAFA